MKLFPPLLLSLVLFVLINFTGMDLFASSAEDKCASVLDQPQQERFSSEQMALLKELRPVRGLDLQRLGRGRPEEKPEWIAPETILLRALARTEKYPRPKLKDAIKYEEHAVADAANRFWMVIKPEVFAKLLEAWDSSQIRLTPEGTIPYDKVEGIPHRQSYEFAKYAENLLEGNLLYILPPAIRNKLEILAKAKRKTLELALDDSHYRQLTEFAFLNPPLPEETTSYPVLHYLMPQRYRDETYGAWKRSDRFGEPAGDKGQWEYSNITAQTSKSLLMKMYGPTADRKNFWALRGQTGDLDLGRLRISENRVDEKVLSLEVLANRAEGEPPEGFFFVNINGDFVPAQRFDNKPIKESCVRCHCTAAGSGVMSFKPFFLNSPEDFRAVGYRNSALIEKLRSVEN